MSAGAAGRTPFTARVLHVVRRIPAGCVATYGEVARLSGRPGAARAVGNIMRSAAEPGLPYHRVVAAGGRIGGFGRSPQLKASLLAAEGLTVRRGRIIGFEEKQWRGERSKKERTAGLSKAGGSGDATRARRSAR